MLSILGAVETRMDTRRSRSSNLVNMRANEAWTGFAFEYRVVSSAIQSGLWRTEPNLRGYQGGNAYGAIVMSFRKRKS